MIIGRWIELVRQATRRTRVRLRGATLGKHCRFGPGVRLRLLFVRKTKGAIRVGSDCEFCDGAIVETWGGDVRIGERVFIGPYTVMYGHGGLEIGDQSLISMHCRILSSNHGISAPGVPIRSQPDVLLPTRIGRDVWLGAGVTVLGGVTIGNGCVVGAGAVVTSDLPPDSIAVGVPARVIRSRI